MRYHTKLTAGDERLITLSDDLAVSGNSGDVEVSLHISDIGEFFWKGVFLVVGGCGYAMGQYILLLLPIMQYG